MLAPDGDLTVIGLSNMSLPYAMVARAAGIDRNEEITLLPLCV